jgi:hypothetical protein
MDSPMRDVIGILLKTLDLKLANVLDIVGTNTITIKGIVLRVLKVIFVN